MKTEKILVLAGVALLAYAIFERMYPQPTAQQILGAGRYWLDNGPLAQQPV